MTFEQAWKTIDKVGVWDALLEDGARALWDAIVSLGRGKHLVEVGCHFGRSSTLLMLLAKEYGHTLTFIDPWAGPPFDPAPDAGDETARAWFDWMRSFRYPFTLHCCRTEDIDPRRYPREIDFLYIDGDHTRRALEIDCGLINQVNPGGIIAFDNYRDGAHTDVEAVVDRLLADGVLERRQQAGIVMVTQDQGALV